MYKFTNLTESKVFEKDLQECELLKTNFSDQGIHKIYELLDQEEEELGVEFKFDAVWIRCAFEEFTTHDCLQEFKVETIEELADYQIVEFENKDGQPSLIIRV